jgi:hypothetical protein
MTNIYRLGRVLVLIGIAGLMAYSQEKGSEYVAPSEAAPRGKAPKMQVQCLNPGEPPKQYAVIFYRGDEAFSGLLEFADKYHVTSAHFTAIGALSGATLGWFDPRRKMYKKIPINGQHEVIGMSGDIALYRGKPVVHNVTYVTQHQPPGWKGIPGCPALAGSGVSTSRFTTIGSCPFRTTTASQLLFGLALIS